MKQISGTVFGAWGRFLRRVFCLPVTCLVVWTLTCGLAQDVATADHKISFRQITRTHPIAVQRGQTAKVRVWSNFTLNNSHSTFFVPAGVRMTQLKEPARKVEFSEPQESDQGEDYGFSVEVPKGQLPGVYEYRIATDQAVSSVGHLMVTDYPVVTEVAGDNHTATTAQLVPIPSAVCGNIDDFEDVDLYRVHGRAGQELVCQIFAQRVTRAIHCMAIQYPKIHLMDSYLTLRDSRGRVVAENDNHVGGDAMLRCRLPASGDYILEVRDSRYAGDPRYVYCVEISEGPMAIATFPLSVQRGHSTTTEVVATQPENVPREAPEMARRVRWDVSADVPVGWRRVRVAGADGKPGPVVPQLVSRHRQVVPVAETSGGCQRPLPACRTDALLSLHGDRAECHADRRAITPPWPGRGRCRCGDGQHGEDPGYRR